MKMGKRNKYPQFKLILSVIRTLNVVSDFKVTNYFCTNKIYYQYTIVGILKVPLIYFLLPLAKSPEYLQTESLKWPKLSRNTFWLNLIENRIVVQYIITRYCNYLSFLDVHFMVFLWFGLALGKYWINIVKSKIVILPFVDYFIFDKIFRKERLVVVLRKGAFKNIF